jgi:hypothetical protein
MSQSGMCLQFVRENYGVPAVYSSAIAAWNGAKVRHTSRPTVGAVPVFFATASQYKHVAFYCSNGTVITTNGAKIERWSSIDSVASGFKGAYMGWTEDLNGYQVYLGGSSGGSGGGAIATDGVWGPGTTKALQRVAGKSQDGIVSSQEQAYKASNPGLSSGSWQWVSKPQGSQIIAWAQGQMGITTDGIAGPQFFTSLQARYGTTQDGVISNPSLVVTKMQESLNAGKF